MPPSGFESTTSIANLPTLWDRESVSRGLGDRPSTILGVFSPSKSHAILAVGVAGASISLVAATISLRWFLLMRRSYRHHLILFLIISDTWKSLWYFIFPIVAFARGGHVESSSNFCQASGFLLALGLETSDVAILMIALHTILYVFRRPEIKGEGGLYPYRKYVYPFWLGFPLLSASLAFTNSRDAYITSGTFCYLPKRPFWYRLALAWIPRYIIFVTIFSMYAAIWIYVQLKFRGFKAIGMDNSRYASGSGSDHHSTEGQSPGNSNVFNSSMPNTVLGDAHREDSIRSHLNTFERNNRGPWENLSFVTTNPLHDTGVAETDFAPDAGASAEAQCSSRQTSINWQSGNPFSGSRKHSEVPTLGTSSTENSPTGPSNATAAKSASSGSPNHLRSTRSAIRHQLRLLFVYPFMYLLMWAFPFASHCLNYSDYWAAHPPFWLSVAATASLSLQATVDCAVFSWRERPWNRVDRPSTTNGSLWASIIGIFHRGDQKFSEDGREQGQRHGSSPNTLVDAQATAVPTAEKRGSNWWEAEGKRRKDSVWMGTDTLNEIISRQELENEQQQEEEEGKEETENESNSVEEEK